MLIRQSNRALSTFGIASTLGTHVREVGGPDEGQASEMGGTGEYVYLCGETCMMAGDFSTLAQVR